MRGGSFKFHHCCIPIDSNTFLLATRAPSRDVRLINDLMNSLAATCNWPIVVKTKTHESSNNCCNS